jgi:hypothetical protein
MFLANQAAGTLPAIAAGGCNPRRSSGHKPELACR